MSSNYNNLNRLRTRIIKFSLGPSWKRKTNDEQGERGVTVDCFVSKTRTTAHSVVRAKNRNHIDRRGIQDLMNQNWGFLNTLGVIFEIRGSSRIGGGVFEIRGSSRMGGGGYQSHFPARFICKPHFPSPKSHSHSRNQKKTLVLHSRLLCSTSLKLRLLTRTQQGLKHLRLFSKMFSVNDDTLLLRCPKTCK